MTFASEENVEGVQVAVSPVTRSEVERDASFYFDDDFMAIFLVENRLFRVHRRYFMRLSQTFRDMFSTANTTEGETDEKPISLAGVTQHEFQTLLKFFYSLPPHVLGEGPVVFPDHATELTLEEKLALLSISHRFLFDDIFRFILQQVQPPSVPVVDRIRLSDKYNIPEWLSSAYTALLDRSPDGLSAEEAEVLGSERVAFLYKTKCSQHQEQSNKNLIVTWLITAIVTFWITMIFSSKA